MTTRVYQAQLFFQYGTPSTGGEHESKLVSFSAPAREIAEWAGVPRKGWTLRALYQRILDNRRLDKIAAFFTPPKGSSAGNLSPTAVTIALTDPGIRIPDTPGSFALSLSIPPLPTTEVDSELARLATQVSGPHLSRLEPATRACLEEYSNGALDRAAVDAVLMPEDYVALFAADLIELAADPATFLLKRKISEPLELLDALYELSKPALIVDGQHRVFGAAQAPGVDVSFLVCAIPKSSWTEQAFQFVVINEEARPVEATVLYDIFGSSLTRSESTDVRKRLGSAGKDVEKRIAAVVAYRDDQSPFVNMVQLRVDDMPADVKPYLSPRLVVELIDGSRNCRGFRADRDFLAAVVRPGLGEGEDDSTWTSWSNGRWRSYWYAFWNAVRDYFNSTDAPLWRSTEQSNLTKGVTLKALQDLLLGEMITKARAAEEQAAELRQLRVEEETIARFLEKHRIPPSVDVFYERIRTDFLDGFPRRFFDRPWVKSLDTAAGIETLRTVLQETWSSYVGKGGSKKYPYWRNALIFETKDAGGEGA